MLNSEFSDPQNASPGEGSSPSGVVFNIMRYSTQDGPGVRTTVFLKGCPLECLWCHNPESIKRDIQFVHRAVRCLRCGACAEICPENVITVDEQGHRRDETGCTWCATCIDVCGSEARQLIGRQMTVDSLISEIIKDQSFYEESGGGVTLSGGEPMAQLSFLHELLSVCRVHGIHTAIDTSGAAPWSSFETILPLTDLFLFDIKVVESQLHRKLTGASNGLILRNLLRLCESPDTDVLLRMPVIPGFTDTSENIAKALDLIAGLPNRPSLMLLPFNGIGGDKYGYLGREWFAESFKPPQPQRMDEIAALFRDHGITVDIGGAHHE